MKGNVLEYKGYSAAVEYSVEDKVLHGKIDGINDLVDFCSEDVSSIEDEFHKAVDDYLKLCEQIGKEPEKTYSGTFNVRINPELHKRISIQAAHNHCSLNAEVEKAIECYLDRSGNGIQCELAINGENITEWQPRVIRGTWNGGEENGFNFSKQGQMAHTFS